MWPLLNIPESMEQFIEVYTPRGGRKCRGKLRFYSYL